MQVTTGWKHACALLGDGTVKCWGFNTSGQLGDGTQTQRLTPVTVAGLPGGKTVSAIEGGFAYTCALFTDGTAACWGVNGNGVLGDGTAASRPTPAPVVGLTNAVEISAGAESHLRPTRRRHRAVLGSKGHAARQRRPHRLRRPRRSPWPA